MRASRKPSDGNGKWRRGRGIRCRSQNRGCQRIHSKFLYFIRHRIWSRVARQVGYFSIDFTSRYDFALSFAGENRDLAEKLSREISVFYDRHEQHRILANDVEEYLALIYRSESRFVVPLLSKEYPKKIWTKFESEQFKQRFGENSVIPIWYSDSSPGIFDESRKVGGMTFNPGGDFNAQLQIIVDTSAKKLESERQIEAINSYADES